VMLSARHHDVQMLSAQGINENFESRILDHVDINTVVI
jgi:hypothetical protein